jgi:ABC-2 type transport system permease protein
MLAKARAFFVRDLRVAVTYRVSFIESFVGMLFGLVSMLFISDLINQGSPDDLAVYGGDYFGFALVGVAFALFVQVVAGQFAGIVRSAQVMGTLEVMLSSRTSLPAFLGYSSLYGFAYAVLRLVVALTVGALFLGAHLQVDDAAIALLAFVLTIATFAGIGIFAAAFVVWFKQPEPITTGLTTLSLLVSGVLYPTTVLPGWLERLAPLLPLTHTMEALRGALLEGATGVSIAGHVAALAGFSLLLPLSLVAFELAVRQAKAAGSLAHY